MDFHVSRRRLNAIQKCIKWIEESFCNDRSVFDQDSIRVGAADDAADDAANFIRRHQEEQGRGVHGIIRQGGSGDAVIDITATTRTTTEQIKECDVGGRSNNHHACASNIGFFAKRDIRLEEAEVSRTLVLLPYSAVLNCTDSTLQEDNIPLLRSILNDTMKEYDIYANAAFEKNKMKEYDFYKHNNGRICHDGEIRLTLFLTILFCFLESCSSSEEGKVLDINIDSAPLYDELKRITVKWAPYLETLPTDFTSLPPFWSKNELQNMEGTCFAKYISRVQNEYIENWYNVIRPSLVNAAALCHDDVSSGDSMLMKVPPEEADEPDQDQNTKMSKLPSYYTRALGIVQSRTHGSGSMSEYGLTDLLGRIDGLSMNVVLHPLLDLVNGERGDEHINTEMTYNPRQRCVELKAIRDIKAGEELIVSYGEAVSLSYLQRFGFLPKRNGLPDLECTCLFKSMPHCLLPDQRDKLRWKKLELHGFHKENLASEIYGTEPFNIIYDNNELRKYRKSELYTPHTCPPQIDHFTTAASVLLMNEKSLKGIPQEPYLESYENGKMMVSIIDLWLSQFNTPSNDFDFALVKKQSGNLRMGTFMRMMERETLIKWRHAICIRHGCYDYDMEWVEPGVDHFPPLGSKTCCYICKASFDVKTCTRCKMVHYCSVKCQKEHWQRGHKEVCGKVRK